MKLWILDRKKDRTPDRGLMDQIEQAFQLRKLTLETIRVAEEASHPLAQGRDPFQSEAAPKTSKVTTKTNISGVETCFKRAPWPTKRTRDSITIFINKTPLATDATFLISSNERRWPSKALRSQYLTDPTEEPSSKSALVEASRSCTHPTQIRFWKRCSKRSWKREVRNANRCIKNSSRIKNWDLNTLMHSLRGKRNEPEANMRKAACIQVGFQVLHFTLKGKKNILRMQEWTELIK